MLEDGLRAAFAAQAQTSPAIVDPASPAIRRARRIRRRRTTVTSAAAVLLLVATLGGALSLRGWYLPPERGRSGFAGPDNDRPEQVPSAVQAEAAAPLERTPASPTSRSTLDAWAGTELWTGSGERMRLTDAAEVRWVYRVPAGWVYGGRQDVRLLRPAGTSVLLANVDGGAPWVVSPDGTRLAFAAGRELAVGTIGPEGLMKARSTWVPAGTVPVLFFGDAVVVSTATGSRYDIWWPGTRYKAAWSTEVTYVYGGNGKTLLGLAHGCLVVIAPTTAGLVPQKAAGCPLAVAAGAEPGLATPDGQWLAQREKDEVRLVDLAAAVRGSTTTRTCPVPVTATPMWTDENTVAAPAGDQVVTCTIDGERQSAPAPAGVPAGWQLVASRQAE